MTPPADFRDDIIDRLETRFREYHEVISGRIFGHVGFSINRRFFCFGYEDGLAIKLHPDDYAKILQLDETESFRPGGSAMGTWAVLTYPDAEQYLDNWHWIDKAMAYIVTDEAAPPKKSRKRAMRGRKK